MKKIFLVFIFSISFSKDLFNFNDLKNNSKDGRLILHVGEELIYDVSYGFIKIGEIKLVVLSEFEKNGILLYKTKAFINSNEALPFVNVHYVFYSEIDPEGYAHYFSGTDTKNPKKHHYQDYAFNYTDKNIIIEKGNRTKNHAYFKAKDYTNVKQQDGLSLFYYSRINLFSKKNINLPTYINEKKGSVFINFVGKQKSIELKAISSPVDAVELNGSINIKGIFGLSGPFVGWFSNDSFGIPLKAKLEVIIGSVNVELKSWKRIDWSPPKIK